MSNTYFSATYLRKQEESNKLSSNIVSMATHRIKKLMAKKGVTHDAIAEVLKITRPAVTHLLNGSRKFSLEQIDSIANYLGIDPIIVLYGQKKLKKSLEKVTGGNKMIAFAIPLLQPAEVHQWRENMENFRTDSNRERLPVPAQYQSCYLYPMYDIAMLSDKSATFSYDDVLICDPNKVPHNGDYVIVQLANQKEAICRKYTIVDDKVKLKAINSGYSDTIPGKPDDITYLGVVVRIITSPSR